MDNTRLNAGTGGDLMATDEVAYSGDTAKVQLVRLVDVAGAEGSKTVSPRLGLTDAELRASAVPVSLTSTTITGTVATTQSGNWSARTQDSAGNGIGSIADGAGLTSLATAIGATNFVVSAANSSTAQLANGATFTGTIETIFNQQAISVLLTSDQAGTLTLNQYIDVGGTRRISQWTFSVAANVPFSRCFVGNGNFFNLTFQNTGGSTTTTLNINTAYGTLPAASNLGNMPVAINEVNGSALALGQAAMASSLPVVLASNQSAVPISAASLPLPTGAAASLAQASTTSGQTGVLMQAAVTTAAPTYTTAQTNPLSMDTAGGLRVATHPVTQSGTWNVTVNAAIAAGANAIGDVGQQYRANATGAASFVSVMSPATPIATVCKASAGRLLGWQLQNSSAAIRSVKFWNTAQGSVTLGTTAALFEVDIPAGGHVNFKIEGGIGFATAITYAVTGAKGLTDNTGTLGVNDVSGCLLFA